MSTPPNPPSTPSGPPTEPTGTPVPEAAPIPAPTQPLSLDKPPALTPPQPLTPAPALTETPAEAPTEAPAPPSDAVPAGAPAEPTDAVPTEPAGAVPAGVGAGVPAAAPAGQPVEAAPAPGPFAPVTPAPAAATAPPAPAWGAPYGAPAPLPVPDNRWATPVGGYSGGYPGGPQAPGFPPPPAAANGLALAALLLGLFGIFVGLVPFFFWAGAILALTGVGIGIAAVLKSRRGAPRATMAAAGTALSLLGLGASVGGWFITTNVVDRIDKNIADNRSRDSRDYEYDYDSPTPSFPARPTPKPSPSPSDVPGMTSALGWGKTFAYEDGVQVTVDSPVRFKPSSTAAPAEARGADAVKLTVKIVNTTGAAIDVTLAMPHARDAQGAEASMVFDRNVPKMFKGSVMPGESMTGVYAFVVPKGIENLHFEIAPGTEYDDAIWSGPIG